MLQISVQAATREDAKGLFTSALFQAVAENPEFYEAAPVILNATVAQVDLFGDDWVRDVTITTHAQQIGSAPAYEGLSLSIDVGRADRPA